MDISFKHILDHLNLLSIKCVLFLESRQNSTYVYNNYLSLPSSFMMPQQLPLALAAVVVVLLNFIRRLCDDKDYNLTTLGQEI